LPPNAKITAEVWSGRKRPKVVYSMPRLSSGAQSWKAMMQPTRKPAMPQTMEATAANFTGPRL
jgi:hypothetical protein